jgi:hypothetical protein
MINREILELILFGLNKGECNLCGTKCKEYFCCKECEKEFKSLEKKIKEL